MSAKTLGDELHEENAQEAWEREMDRHNLATMTELDYALNCAAVEIDTTNARAELAQLRADLQKAQERIAQLEAAIAFSDAEQARQRDAVREILSVFCNQDHTGKELYTAYDRADDWLAANPAPQVEQP